MLDSEVVDLRVCLRSADRELAELKDDLKREKRTHDTRTMDFLRRVSLAIYMYIVTVIIVPYFILCMLI